MNIDLTKYLKNKDIKFKNDDFDIEALSNDIKTEATKGLVSKTEVDNAVKAKDTEWTGKYSALETNYNNTVKQLGDTNSNMAKVSLEKTMVLKGFKEDKFDEVSKLRSSLFADEKDDAKAIDSIADKFKGTYFAESAPVKPTVPNEAGLKGNPQGTNNAGAPVKIDRNTPLSNMFIAK